MTKRLFFVIFLKLALIGSCDTRLESSKSILELSSTATSMRKIVWASRFLFWSFSFLSAGGKLFS